MAKIYIKEYLDMDSEACVHDGYMILKQDYLYYVRLAGFPLMVLLEFSNIEDVHSWIDSQDKRQLPERIKEISNIRKIHRRFG